MKREVIIVGTGEIGMPMYELLNGVFDTIPIDPVHFEATWNVVATCDFLHICIPGEIKNFNKVVLGYIDKYKPRYVIIHSTVKPGTVKNLNYRLYKPIIVHAPVHGKHQGNQMKKDMLRYPKYVGVPETLEEEEIKEIKEHFERAGFFDVRIFKGTDTTEWLKVLATTYFGLQIAWAQEVERICDKHGLDYDAVSDFFSIQEDVKKPVYPGVIGGHCIMPNIKLMKKVHKSGLLNWIEKSNKEKEERENG
jgi:UDP-N-acetyl-D-mannosaminuronate dehydrogenase